MNRTAARRTARRGLYLLVFLVCGGARGADTAVVFMYHHVGDTTPASTSVSAERFAAHMSFLEDEGYTVAPLMQVVRRLRRMEPIAPNTVVITFDDGYESVLTRAAPALARRNWPFTVFVTTDYVDGEYDGYLSWEDLRTLAQMGATIGNHTTTHAHLVRRLPGERPGQWRHRVATEIRHAAARIEAELGSSGIPALAYPYGEYDAQITQLAGELELIALGQHSGALGTESDWLALPRFPVATGYDSIDDLRLRARARPLVIELVEPEKHVSAGGSPPLEGIVLSDDVQRSRLACFAGGQGAMQLEWLDTQSGRFVARPIAPLQPGRTKYNCTAPSSSDPDVYHWFSHLWMTKQPNGDW